ncbi:MAG: energy transducer TonB [Pseudomonadota bacterium]
MKKKTMPQRALAAALGALATMAAGSAQGATIIMGDEPAVVKAVPPVYPRAAERRSMEGSVTVSVDVDDSGEVTAVSVVTSEPAGVFDSAAMKAVERWKFEQGKAKAGVVKVIRFQLQS